MMKETLAEVKCRLVKELAERTETRVRYWMRREEWCRSRPGSLLIIGWESVIVSTIFADEAVNAEAHATREPSMGVAKAVCPAYSCVEIPD
jgi:hypothetical protein